MLLCIIITGLALICWLVLVQRVGLASHQIVRLQAEVEGVRAMLESADFGLSGSGSSSKVEKPVADVVSPDYEDWAEREDDRR